MLRHAFPETRLVAGNLHRVDRRSAETEFAADDCSCFEGIVSSEREDAGNFVSNRNLFESRYVSQVDGMEVMSYFPTQGIRIWVGADRGEAQASCRLQCGDLLLAASEDQQAPGWTRSAQCFSKNS